MPRFSEEQLVTLVAALYEAATEPGLWPQVMESLRAQLGGSGTGMNSFVLTQPDLLNWYKSIERAIEHPGESFVVGSGTGESKAAQHRYLSQWVERDSFSPAVVTRSASRGLLTFDRRELSSDDDLARSPFYQEFGRAHEFFHVIGGADYSPDRTAGFFFLAVRPKSASAFEARDLKFIKLLLPHLRRTQVIHRSLWGLRREQETRAAALAALDRPILAVDARGRVLWLTRTAEELLRREDGLQLRGGHLRATLPWQHGVLLEALRRRARLGQDVEGQAGGTLAFTRRLPAAPLRVTLLPAGEPSPASGTALLLLSDPDERRIPPPEVLQRLYKLTPAESRVAALLAEGHSPEDISGKLHVSLGTVRNQLKQVFGKTGAHRQSDLVRLVLSLPAAR